MSRSERGLSRVLEKLEASVRAGQYYEAHQMYRTLYFRYLSQNKYTELLALLSKGALQLLEREQQGSGADLALLLVNVLVQSQTAPTEEWIDNLARLFELMSPGIPERDSFLTNSVKWSMDENKKGHPLLHKRFAEIFWKEKKFSEAHQHFRHSSDGAAYAEMLIELHQTRGMRCEVDLFIAQAVLQILCLRNIVMAMDTFNKYTGSHPIIKNNESPPNSVLPLLNFLWYLLRAISNQEMITFQYLRTQYSVTISRDPNYSWYLDNIGRIWFGIELPRDRNPSRNSMLGGILNSIIGDGDSSGDEDDVRPGASVAPLELD